MPDFDDWLDHQLRNVSVPPDLEWRLTQIGSADQAQADDGRLDAVLKNVPVPNDLAGQLQHVARRRQPTTLWPHLALAAIAVIILVLALGTYGTRTVGPTVAQPEPRHAENATAATIVPVPSALGISGASEQQDLPALAPVVVDEVPERAIEHHEPIVRVSRPQVAERRAPKPALTWAQVNDAARVLVEALDDKRARLTSLGASGALERLPVLESFEASASRGITPPRVRGYDLLFQLKHGEHPFSSPSIKDLASSRMPFSFRTASFDRSLGTARGGQWPAAEEIRVEDFLAAQEYQLPPVANRGLALHSAASPSPLGEPGLHLLQLVVQSGSKKTAPPRPQHLIVVVDMSSRMAAGGRWEMALRSLGRIAGSLGDASRITLIGAAEKPRLLVVSETADSLRALIVSDRLPRPGGRADFTSSTSVASEASKRGDDDGRSAHVVFLAAERGSDDRAAMSGATEAWSRLTAGGIPWQVISLTPGVDAADESAWTDAARQAGGEIHTVSTSADVVAAVLGGLNGGSPVVASGASLKVTFNPQVVTGYRLLGHASSTLTGQSADPLEVDLPANQTATAMYELWIKPEGPDHIAAIELSWQEPASGQPRRLARAIRRGQIAASFSQSPAWFQQGVVAAKTAEVLRGSYFAPSVHPFDRVRELARQVDSRTAARPDFQALMQLLDEAEKLR
jgi:Ca-activated chloride channel homolog